MRPSRVAALLCLCAAAASAQEIARQEYHQRREALRKQLTDGVFVMYGPGGGEGAPRDTNFQYLTGWDQPGSIILLTPAGETMFLPPRRPAAQENFTGRMAAATDENAARVTGFDQVLPTAQFEAQLLKELEKYPRLFTITNAPYAARLRALVPMREPQDARPMLTRLRLKKSPAEIAMIERSTAITVQGLKDMWRRFKPGLYEYQAAATLTFDILDHGCDGHAFPPIVGSGINATILHYSKNSRQMQAGELVVMDVGAQCGGYATDITRTAPVSGKFTPRQRELYEVVLGANKAIIAALKPGMIVAGGRNTPNSIDKIAFDYINTHGKDLKGEPLGKYLTHGVGHSVGLDVHDPQTPGPMPVEPGMVVTVEPGVYLPEEGIGIRVEDTVLITEDGAKVLTSAIPKEIADIEKIMAKK
jgi:Xaa-Pro aminopeptidase